MHPIERLRWIARADGEPAAVIAGEAAWTLSELAASEPAAVLTASRRLVERHPACGPLWWVCAKLVTCEDAYQAASAAAAELAADPVADTLAAALRTEIATSDVVVAAPPCDMLRDALSLRPVYGVRVAGDYRSLRADVRSLGLVVDDVTGYGPEELDDAVEGASVLVLEALVAGPSGLLVTAEAARAAEAAQAVSLPVWGVLGVGRVLGGPMAVAAMAGALAAAAAGGADYEVLEPGSLSAAVDHTGLTSDVAAALRRTSCPNCPELVPRGL